MRTGPRRPGPGSGHEERTGTDAVPRTVTTVGPVSHNEHPRRATGFWFYLDVLLAGRKTRRRLDARALVDGDADLLSLWTRHHIEMGLHSARILDSVFEARLMRLIERNQRKILERAGDPRLRRRLEDELLYLWQERNPDRVPCSDEVIYVVEHYTPEPIHPALWLLLDRHLLTGWRTQSVWGAEVVSGVLATPRYVYELIESQERQWQTGFGGIPSQTTLSSLGPAFDKPGEEELEVLRSIWDSDPGTDLHDLGEALRASRQLN